MIRADFNNLYSGSFVIKKHILMLPNSGSTVAVRFGHSNVRA
jgi:hypothetical protein